MSFSQLKRVGIEIVMVLKILLYDIFNQNKSTKTSLIQKLLLSYKIQRYRIYFTDNLFLLNVGWDRQQRAQSSQLKTKLAAAFPEVTISWISV